MKHLFLTTILILALSCFPVAGAPINLFQNALITNNPGLTCGTIANLFTGGTADCATDSTGDTIFHDVPGDANTVQFETPTIVTFDEIVVTGFGDIVISGPNGARDLAEFQLWNCPDNTYSGCASIYDTGTRPQIQSSNLDVTVAPTSGQFFQAVFVAFSSNTASYNPAYGPRIDSLQAFNTATPEPATLSLIGAALVGLTLVRRRK